MVLFRRFALFGLALLAVAPAAEAQQRSLHIGYVYPAGGQQGATFEAVIGGQFLAGFEEVVVSGGGVKATLLELAAPISGKELNDLRIRIDELLARKAVVRKDFTALEKFRSFKNAKDLKTDRESSDKELEELKRKYAGATWTPEDEKLLMETRKKMTSSVRKPANPAISELAIVQFTVAPDAEPGQRELRIVAASGLSNPLVFCVGRLIEFSEKVSRNIPEQKSTITKTAFAPKSRKTEPETSVTLPAIVNGQILPGEVDRYRFKATKGQRLVVAVGARQLVPYIPDAVPGWFQATLALHDAEGKELAYYDDYRFNPDPVLYYEIPAEGEYVVEIKDAIYRGREDFVYRITLGELPFVTSIFPLGGPAGKKTTLELTGWNLPVTSLALNNKTKTPGIHPVCLGDERWFSNVVPFMVDTLPECLDKEPNNQDSSAQPVALPVVVNGRMDQADDADVFCFEGRAGSEIVAEVHARRLNSPVDSVLKLTDAAGRQLAMNDDHEDQAAGLTTHHADSWLRATLPSDGKYYVHLGDMQHKGGPEYGYRLRISAPRPDFDLRAAPSSITVRSARTVPMTVYALRKDGFSGEIALALKDAPEGCSLGGGRIPANENRVRLTLTLPPIQEQELFNVSLEGRAVIDGREVCRPVVPAEDMMQAFEYRHLVPSQELKIAVSGRSPSNAVVRILGETPVRIPAGGTAAVRVRVASSKLLDRIQLELSEPPDGIAIKKVSPCDDGMELLLESNAAQVKPGLKGNLIVTASARGAGTLPKGKPQGGQRRAPLATLPAIPFEVVGP
ncbi:MAG: hypothetical protein HUU20_28790 [Pirellulales bacterium]|nr:hypothetical protein [Pirellulales bacterium]